MIKAQTLLSVIVLWVSVVVPRQAAAHDTLPKDWCTEPDMVPVIAKTFAFDGGDLRLYVEKCGIVDQDDWHAAHAGMLHYCNAHPAKELPALPPLESLVMPYIEAPNSFVNKDHHLTYRIDDGIAGSCVVCVLKK